MRRCTTRGRRRPSVRLQLEGLESRQLLSVSAVDDRVTAVVNRDLLVGEREEGQFVQLESVGAISAPGDIQQLEYSQAHDRLVVRDGTHQVRIYDGATNQLVNEATAIHQFTDMDLTSDQRYLFVADFGGERIGMGEPLLPSWVLRYDLRDNVWTRQRTATVAFHLEAIASDEVLVQRSNQRTEMMLLRYTGTAEPATELSRIDAGDSGDIEHDPNTGRIFHANANSSSNDIHVRVIWNDQLRGVESSRHYETAPAQGGKLVLSPDGMKLYFGKLQVDAQQVTSTLRQFPQAIVAATNALAFGVGGYFSAETGEPLGQLPFTANQIHASDDGEHIWAYRPDDGTVHHFRQVLRGIGLLANDDATDRTAAELVEMPHHGEIVSWKGNGEFRYRPNKDYVGTDSFTYRITAADSTVSTATVSIEIQPRSVANQPPVAPDQTLYIDAGSTLTISEEAGYRSAGIVPLAHFEGLTGISQFEYSEKHELLFARLGISRLAIIDAVTGSILEQRYSQATFSDMDLSPSEDFLFVSDYAGDQGFDVPSTPRSIHRFNLKTREWELKTVPRLVAKVEAVDDDRFLLFEGGDLLDLTLNSFGSPGSPVTEHAKISAGSQGDIEYNPSTSTLYHGIFRLG